MECEIVLTSNDTDEDSPDAADGGATLSEATPVCPERIPAAVEGPLSVPVSAVPVDVWIPEVSDTYCLAHTSLIMRVSLS